MRKISIVIMLMLSFCLFTVNSAKAQAPGECIIITELFIDSGSTPPFPPFDNGDANGDGTTNSFSTDDEFMEIVNVCDQFVDMSSWKVLDFNEDNNEVPRFTDADAPSPEFVGFAVRHIFDIGFGLQPNAGVVVFGGGDPQVNAVDSSGNPVFGVPPDFVQTTSENLVTSTGRAGWVMNNSSDTFRLTDADFNIVQEITYPTPIAPAGVGDAGPDNIPISPAAVDNNNSLVRSETMLDANTYQFSFEFFEIIHLDANGQTPVDETAFEFFRINEDGKTGVVGYTPGWLNNGIPLDGTYTGTLLKPELPQAPVVTVAATTPDLDPTPPLATEGVTITANVSDNETPPDQMTVVIAYTVDGGAELTEPMTLTSSKPALSSINQLEGTFEGTIPAQPDGARIEAFVRATDANTPNPFIGRSAGINYFSGTTPIDTALETDGAGSVKYRSYSVRARGVVTLEPGIISERYVDGVRTLETTDFYIADVGALNGGNVADDFDAPGAAFPGGVPNRGDILTVVGVAESFGTAQLSFDPGDATNEGPGTLPDPIVTSIASINCRTLPTGDCDGILVTLEGVSITGVGGLFPTDEINLTDVVDLIVTDDGGTSTTTVRIYGTTDIDGSAAPAGGTFDLTGIIRVESGEILVIPRDRADIFNERDTSANTPPVLDAIGDRNVAVSQSLTINPTASDADGDDLFFAVRGGDGTEGLFTFTGFDTGNPTFAFLSDALGTFTFTFFVNDRNGGGDSEEITITVRESGFIPVGENIRDVKVDADGDFNADRTGETVTVSGVITTPNIRANGSHYAIQDGSGGIEIFSASDTYFAEKGLTVGTAVGVTGTVSPFNGDEEISPASSDDVVILGTGKLPFPLSVSPVDVQEGNGEVLQGTIIKMENVTLQVPDPFPDLSRDQSLTFLGSGGLEVSTRVHAEVGFTQADIPTSPTSIVGLLTQFDGSEPRSGGYQIVPLEFSSDIDADVVSLRTARMDANGDFLPDNIGETVTVNGIVTSINIRPGQLQYSIEDGTAGLTLFSTNAVFADFNPEIGDVVRAVGPMSPFNGLDEIAPGGLDDVEIVGNTIIVVPTPVTADILGGGGGAGEPYESRLVKVSNVYFVTEFPTSGGSYNATAADLNGTEFVVRIDSDVDIHGTREPSGLVNVTGNVGQFDGSDPRDEGYQLLPRFLPDLEVVAAKGDLNADGAINILDLIRMIDIIVGIPPAASVAELFLSDLTGDDAINVGDVVAVIRIILGTSSSPAVAAADRDSESLRSAEITLASLGSNPTALPVTLQLEGSVSAVLLEIDYDNGSLAVEAPILGKNMNGMSLISSHKDGKLVAVIYNLGGKTISTGKTDLLNIPLAVTGENAGNGISLAKAVFLGRNGEMLEIGKGLDTATSPELPNAFALGQNFPNPFNPSTTIRFDIPGTVEKGVNVSLQIFDLRGQVVRTLIDNELKMPGGYQIHWNGKNDRQQNLSSGIYFYRIAAGEFVSTKKMILLK